MSNQLPGQILYQIAAIIAILSIVIAFIRLIKGPTVADRVVALDTMTLISISLIVYLASMLNRVIYVDVGIVYALISFLGVIAVARYLEKGL